MAASRFDKDEQRNTAKPPREALINEIVKIIVDNEPKSDDDVAALVMDAMRARRIELEPRAVFELIAEVRTTT